MEMERRCLTELMIGNYWLAASTYKLLNKNIDIYYNFRGKRLPLKVVNILEMKAFLRFLKYKQHRVTSKVSEPRDPMLFIHQWTLIKLSLLPISIAGLGGSVGCAVRLETRRSRIEPPPRSATFFRGDWSWNIFLRSFSPFRWFKKDSCQFLAKECAQYWLTFLRTKPAQ